MSTEPTETHDRRKQEGAGTPDVDGLLDAPARGEVVPLGMLRRDDLERGDRKGANLDELISTAPGIWSRTCQPDGWNGEK